MIWVVADFEFQVNISRLGIILIVQLLVKTMIVLLSMRNYHFAIAKRNIVDVARDVGLHQYALCGASSRKFASLCVRLRIDRALFFAHENRKRNVYPPPTCKKKKYFRSDQCIFAALRPTERARGRGSAMRPALALALGAAARFFVPLRVPAVPRGHSDSSPPRRFFNKRTISRLHVGSFSQ